MGLFGTTAAGTVAVMSDVESQSAGLVTVTGLGKSSVVLIQRAGIEQAVNMQIAPTLGSTVYCYAMGDRPGRSLVSGTCLAQICGGGGGNGYTELGSFYSSHKATTTQRRVTVTLGDGGMSATGYLLAMRVEADNPMMRSGSFSMDIAVISGMA